MRSAICGGDPEVVGHEQERRARLVAQPADQFEDLRLHGHVERGRRLVGDHQRRDCRRSPSRSSPAAGAHPTARAGTRACAAPPRAHRPTRAAARASSADPAASATWRADAHRRVQRGHRVLEHRAEVMAPQPAPLVGRRGHHVEPGDDRAAGDASVRDRRRAGRGGTSPSTLLPEPDSPTRPTISPGAMSSDTPRSARRPPAPRRSNVTCTSRTDTSGSAGGSDACPTSGAASATVPIDHRAHDPITPPSGPRGGSCRRWAAGGRSR